jgi:hypothetical protein
MPDPGSRDCYWVRSALALRCPAIGSFGEIAVRRAPVLTPDLGSRDCHWVRSALAPQCPATGFVRGKWPRDGRRASRPTQVPRAAIGFVRRWRRGALRLGSFGENGRATGAVPHARPRFPGLPLGSFGSGAVVPCDWVRSGKMAARRAPCLTPDPGSPSCHWVRSALAPGRLPVTPDRRLGAKQIYGLSKSPGRNFPSSIDHRTIRVERPACPGRAEYRR